MTKIDVLTLFPEMMEAVLGESIIGRARNKGLININCTNIRDFTKMKHGHVDDGAYGGGRGMVMAVQPVLSALESVKRDDIKPFVIYMSPQGKVFNQEIAKELLLKDHLVFLCGHYEGIDERIIENAVDMELSIGDYVLTGGEIPAMAVIDAVCRMVKGVLPDEEAFTEESHFNGLLEYPQYTRPEEIFGEKVPEILLSGHHKKIENWRRRQSLYRTWKKRPDMLKTAHLTKSDREYLEKYKGKRRKTAKFIDEEIK
ncbi:MAG: tRNA (guanosine(37)-N1)-methyltransferase TrmD [Clostridia bacterium]|nr:tRNA (guanosine(37)-N1)-methyltransferase TrmD [Clostridia bacterium]